MRDLAEFGPVMLGTQPVPRMSLRDLLEFSAPLQAQRSAALAKAVADSEAAGKLDPVTAAKALADDQVMGVDLQTLNTYAWGVVGTRNILLWALGKCSPAIVGEEAEKIFSALPARDLRAAAMQVLHLTAPDPTPAAGVPPASSASVKST